MESPVLPTRREIEDAARVIYQIMPPTPQLQWPLLNQKIGLDLWLKHENQAPLGAFKIRGGITYFEQLLRRQGHPRGVVCATRGNHGQSVARAANHFQLPSTVVVPRKNSSEKNAAMRALGANLIENGDDFQEAFEFAKALAVQEGLHFVPSYHHWLVQGVATYSWELFQAVEPLDYLYVPIGLGSGICGAVAARNGLGLNTEIVGVVSSRAPAYRLSFDSKRSIESPATTIVSDGVACRKPNDEALHHILNNVSRVVAVDDEDVEHAMRVVFECTHNTVEGAGAIAVAAICNDAEYLVGKKVAGVLSGGNIDRLQFAKILGKP